VMATINLCEIKIKCWIIQQGKGGNLITERFEIDCWEKSYYSIWPAMLAITYGSLVTQTGTCFDNQFCHSSAVITSLMNQSMVLMSFSMQVTSKMHFCNIFSCRSNHATGRCTCDESQMFNVSSYYNVIQHVIMLRYTTPYTTSLP